MFTLDKTEIHVRQAIRFNQTSIRVLGEYTIGIGGNDYVWIASIYPMCQILEDRGIRGGPCGTCQLVLLND